MRVVLVIDEYHLDIRAEDDLISRYYLADVEVARDIAERFILFLDDGEMEFLADDALKFAYDGVAAMQEAWLAAQKKRRRHRKAAVQSARRKDSEPTPEPEPVSQRVVNEPARPQRSRQGDRPAPATAPTALAKRLEAAAAPVAAPAGVVEETPVPASPPPAAASSRNGKGRPRKASSAAPAPPPVRVEPEPVPLAPTELPSPFDAVDEVRAVVAPVSAKEAKRAKKRKAPEEVPVQTPRNVRVKELPVAVPEPVEEPPPVEDPLEVRFAADGHHPAETSVGLLSRLRRQPKIPDNHIHRFRESGSGVGLVRRVCIECSYVSISSND
ncbi:MAG TPA: hypothetical protein VFY46_02525 [Acidimicrobiia bacterium]|nr:hypothetical protein [Acidimicrobiia bacterium]